MKQIVV